MMKHEIKKMFMRAFHAAFSLLSLLFVLSCGNTNHDQTSKTDTLISDTVKSKPISLLEKKLDSLGLVDVHAMDTTIAVDLKYSTSDNFMGFDMYGDFTKAYLQKDVADKLLKAQKKLTVLKPGYYLIIYDAVRPRSIQQLMWDSLKMPLSEKYKYLADPATGSLHNYGCAVDLSIADEKGNALDMGTAYDFSGEAAWPSKETEMLLQKKITQSQIDNRILLRKVMKAGGFSGIKTEWWHFDACSISVAKSMYRIIE
jgi:zinc D-Ala-D-Ala dipeptidase